MFFVLSKILWAVMMPSTAVMLVVLLALASFIVLPNTYYKGLKRLASVLVVVLLPLLVFPVGDWAMIAWEKKAPPLPSLPAKIDGIIALGGAVDPFITANTGQVAISGQGERYTVLPGLMRRYPKAQIVISGGSGDIQRQKHPEADAVRILFQSWGLALSRVIFENKSRNTFENVSLSRELVKPNEKQTWLLVTSAAHMPRAVEAFRQEKWAVVPYPVDFRGDTSKPVICLCWSDTMDKLDIVTHETIGLWVYHWKGNK